MFTNSMQVVYIGGLFAQFRRDSNNKYIVDQSGVGEVAAVQLALDKVNNKTDNVFDDLLPNTQVCHIKKKKHVGAFCSTLTFANVLRDVSFSSNC